jgi:hypothetical protein
LDCPATLTWGDHQGQSRSLQAKALDISDSGVRIEASERIEVQTVLDIWIERYDTSSSAVVLHCARRGSRFVLGLEFESLTAIPREHLGFAIWFLKGKQHIQVGENSDYVITPFGAEFLESHIQSSPILYRLLQAPRWKPAAREREQELVLAI